eukprot:m51a1_g12388 hypothetical protein (95) ;mRNA; r:650711-651148
MNTLKLIAGTWMLLRLPLASQHFDLACYVVVAFWLWPLIHRLLELLLPSLFGPAPRVVADARSRGAHDEGSGDEQERAAEAEAEPEGAGCDQGG